MKGLNNYNPNGQTVLVNLSEWWNGVFGESWQHIDSIFNGNHINFTWGGFSSSNKSNRLSLKHVKLVDIGILLHKKAVDLIVSVKENEEKEVLIKVVSRYEKYLPLCLKLKVTFNTNTTPESQEVIAREADNTIQLEFSKASGKQFQVEVSYQDAVVHEEFVL